MFIKKYLLILVIVSSIFLITTSCSEGFKEEYFNTNNIDLSLVNENNWEYSEEIFQLINAHRISIGKTQLLTDSLFATAYAVEHSKYMIETKTVNHDNFNMRYQGLINQGANNVGENVAFGYNSANSVFNAWLNSEHHRYIIEYNYTHVGFGVIKSSFNDKYYYTLLFYN